MDKFFNQKVLGMSVTNLIMLGLLIYVVVLISRNRLNLGYGAEVEVGDVTAGVSAGVEQNQ